MKDRRAAAEYRQKRHSCADKVDRVEDLDLDAISREDLIWQHGTGVSVSHGTGRAKTYTYRSGVQTKAGNLELSVWTAAARYVVKRDGLEAEAGHLREFFTQHGYRIGRTSGAREREVLCCCISGLYQNPQWVGFVPYNQRYHPEALKKAHLVRMISVCCQTPGFVTEEQIAGSCDGKVACPVCGCFSNYKRLS